MLENEIVNLANLANGAAAEVFQAEFHKVIRNIMDPNTDAEEKRAVILTVEITPNDRRNEMDVKIKVKSKLAGIVPAGGHLYITAEKEVVQIAATEQEIPFSITREA